MSAVEDLRTALASLASDCEQTSAALAQFGESFDSQSEQVQALIGSTSTGADQAIAQRYEHAKSAVEDAVKALAEAASESNDYASAL